MNILFVNVTYSLGGAAKIAQAIFRQVGGVFFYGNGRSIRKDPEDGKTSNVLRVGSVLTKILNKYLFKISGRDAFTAHKHLWRSGILKAEVVHLHAIHSYFVNFSFLFNLLISQNKKIVWTFHDSWALTGRCALPSPCVGYESGCKKCVLTTNYPNCICDSFSSNYEKKKRLVLSVPRKNMVVVVPTRWMQEKVQKSYYSEFPIRIVRNGIDLEQFSFRQSSITHKKLRVLIVANCFGAQKGLSDFLKIVTALPMVDFVVVGTMPDNIQVNNVFSIGYISSREKLIEEYHLADFMLFLSVDDNYPTVILESLACGTPVISYRGLGNKEIFEELDYPYLVDDGDTTAVINILQRFVAENGDFLEYERLSRQGRTQVEKNNDLKKMVAEYKKIYEKLCEK